MAETAFWRDLFKVAVAERGAVEVSRELGYNNHTLVSRIWKGRIDASPRFIARVMERYHVVKCPHSGEKQARAQCQVWLDVAAPTHNPGALAHWRACQRCPHRPQGEPKC